MRQAEQAYLPHVAVIGVHCGKFSRERETDRIADAMRREGVAHPVLNDAGYEVWKAYAVRAWPTLVFIDPGGRVFARHEGEISSEDLARILQAEIDGVRAADSLSGDPPPTSPLPAVGSTLLFPSALAFGERDALFVADSGHHRVLQLGPRQDQLIAFGTGSPGFSDGPAGEALFHDPHGLCVGPHQLLVADSGNHSIRRIGLPHGDVSTLAGTGHLARHFLPPAGPRQTDLRSPWDLYLRGDELFVAMSGSHQVWRLDLRRQTIAAYAGSGYEALYDSSLQRSRFAQPMGLCGEGEHLYVADAESSAIRDVPLGGEGLVRTLIGKGLFEFGDRDGPLGSALLQHPAGVAAHGDRLYVADTYNDKVRLVLLREGRVETFLDGLREPQAVAVHDGFLYAADTGNHRIVRVSLDGGPPQTVLE